ncbi:hypothetical protein [Pseudorhodobacter sp.]|uniref:hypothetical protein n=1 Tax=Pseudorhodobacter sp. TaxID=1934400 RepID=UPI0026477B9B|nr:hypothetical protein [Pseudorhodobacter sp.]MDN5787756.1 hypothetical protein [Pseudorhodobacter sp.]
MKYAAPLAVVGLLAGCAGNGAMPDTPLQRAKAVVAASLVGTAPQYLMPRIADCVAGNASTAEIDSLQAAIDRAPNAATRTTARAILRRAETRSCLLRHGVRLVKG